MDARNCYRQHANAYVIKPVGLDGFTRTVEGIDEFFTQIALLPSVRSPAQ